MAVFENIKRFFHAEDQWRKRLSPRYKAVCKIGQGAFSVVYRGYDGEADEDIAIKVIDKQSLEKSQFHSVLKEVAVMSRITHPNIVRKHAFIDDSHYCIIIMDLLEGGEVFDQIVEKTHLSESVSRHIVTQLMDAVMYLHEDLGIVHRDIKPENLLCDIDQDGNIGRIKLADFGLSKVLWDNNTKTPCGTLLYTAPEVVLNQRYCKSVDVWSIGCVLYTLLCGFNPFRSSDHSRLVAIVGKGKFTFPSPWWDTVSSEAKDLVSHLLEVDPAKRYTLHDMKKHRWMVGETEVSDEEDTVSECFSWESPSPLRNSFFHAEDFGEFTPKYESVTFEVSPLKKELVTRFPRSPAPKLNTSCFDLNMETSKLLERRKVAMENV